LSSGIDVLIVEDDFDIREVLGEVLADEGFRVLGVSNGQEALDHLKDGHPPRLILLDLMMPVMSGWQFVSEQKKNPRISNIPVVVVSADGNLQQKASSLGASGFLRKPIEIEALLEVVQHYCRQAREG